MATATEPETAIRVGNSAEQRIVLSGVSWETYQKLSEEIGDRRGLKSYNRGVLELMSPGLNHEDYKKRLDELIKILAEELGLPFKWMGSTKWDDPASERGLEADECYLLTAEKVARVVRNRPKKAEECPRPDLAVEVDISRPAVDRSVIYATLGIAEVWRFDGKLLQIDQLRADGGYEPAKVSRFLPIPPEEVVRWVVLEEEEDDVAWARRLRAWVKATLAPRPNLT